MKSKSAKDKGRRAVLELRERLLKGAPELSEGDVEVKTTSAPGEDLWLSPAARKAYPFVFEVKNVEKLNVWDAIAQADAHALGTPYAPALVFKRNRSDMYVAVRLDDFIRLLRRFFLISETEKGELKT